MGAYHLAAAMGWNEPNAGCGSCWFSASPSGHSWGHGFCCCRYNKKMLANVWFIPASIIKDGFIRFCSNFEKCSLLHVFCNGRNPKLRPSFSEIMAALKPLQRPITSTQSQVHATARPKITSVNVIDQDNSRIASVDRASKSQLSGVDCGPTGGG